MPGQILKRPNLAKEITLALLLKAVVIYALWSAFFSQPLDDHLSGPAVGKVLFGSAERSSPLAGPMFIPEDQGKGDVR